MKQLKELLKRLQTFELKLIRRIVPEDSTGASTISILAYDISHETKYYDSYTFESELRILTDLATIDLIGLDANRILIVLGQLKQVVGRFKTFWKNYYGNYMGHKPPFDPGYLIHIGLHDLFIVRNLKPEFENVRIEEKFMDDLEDSIRLRESFLKEFIGNVQNMIPPEEAPKKLPEKNQNKIYRKVSNTPVFVEGVANKYFAIIKCYFSQQDQRDLEALLRENQPPASPLLFHGSANQLVDAFKQLYEANLIVGCNKGVLEAWIRINFAYVYRNEQKTFPANYLNAIISSNSKPCQSPILNVKKQLDGAYYIIPVLRTKRNYTSGR